MANLLPDIIIKTAKYNTIIVTENLDLINQGASISLNWISDINGFETLEYYYNGNNIKKQDVKISYEFIGFGKEIITETEVIE